MKTATEMHLSVPFANKEKIGKEIIKCIHDCYNKSIDDIQDKLPPKILEVLTKMRKDTIIKETSTCYGY